MDTLDLAFSESPSGATELRPQLALLQDAFVHLATGQFADAERVLASLSESREFFSWYFFVDLLVRVLCPAERLYQAQAFARRPGQADLRAKHEQLLDKLKGVAEDSSRVMLSREVTARDLADLCNAVCVIVSARRDLVSVYCEVTGPQASSQTAAKLVDYAAHVDGILTLVKKCDSRLLVRFGECVTHELATLRSLLKAQVAQMQFVFKESVMHLYEAKLGLDQWHGAASATSPTAVPPLAHGLLLRLHRVYKHLVARCSLFFNRLLPCVVGPPVSLQRFPAVEEALPRDFYMGALSWLQQKSGVVHVTVLLAAAGTQYNADGYTLPSAERPVSSGLRSVPVLFAAPPAAEFGLSHHVTVISLLSDMETALKTRKLVFFSESDFKGKADKDRERFAYFLIQVDEHVYIAAVYPLKGKKGVDRDADQLLRTTLPRLTAHIRNAWIGDAAALK